MNTLDIIFESNEFKSMDGQSQALYKLWLLMENCSDHKWEKITSKNTYIHPPKCVKECGAVMPVEERIKIGLTYY